jgi:hypothetical protein
MPNNTKTFNLILMYTKIIIAYSIEASNKLDIMEKLLDRLKTGQYVDKIRLVRRNVQVRPYEWKLKFFPGGIIIVDNTTNKEVYELEFADTNDVVMVLLAKDIYDLKRGKEDETNEKRG